MKIVFLDIDGVLNHAHTREKFNGIVGIDDYNLFIFADFMKRANELEDTKIVLSSSWRYEVNYQGEHIKNGYDYICERLSEYNLSVFDITPLFKDIWGYGNRGEEIAIWLKEHKDLNITGYVILDDENQREFKDYGLTPRFIQTSWVCDGFKGSDAKIALNMLKEPYLDKPVQILEEMDKEYEEHYGK